MFIAPGYRRLCFTVLTCLSVCSQIPADPRCNEQSPAPRQEVHTMCMSPAEQTLAVSTDRGQLYSFSLSPADINRVTSAAPAPPLAPWHLPSVGLMYIFIYQFIRCPPSIASTAHSLWTLDPLLEFVFLALPVRRNILSSCRSPSTLSPSPVCRCASESPWWPPALWTTQCASGTTKQSKRLIRMSRCGFTSSLLLPSFTVALCSYSNKSKVPTHFRVEFE